MLKNKIVLGLVMCCAVFLLSGCNDQRLEEDVAPDSAGVERNSISDDSEKASQGATDSTEKITGSMEELVKKIDNVKCTYEESDIQGTIYIADQGKQFRSETVSTKIAYHNIIVNAEEKVIYSWAKYDEMPEMATKMSMTDMESAFSNLPNQNAEAGGAVDVSESYDFQCEAWQVDPKKFQPPTNVNFMDMSEMMKNLPF